MTSTAKVKRVLKQLTMSDTEEEGFEVVLEVEMVLVVLVVEETEMVGESVRSMVMLSWPEFPASGELLAGLDDSSDTTTS